ncbi:phosphonoacetaldehyde reductase [Pelagibacterales bacterium SAG-MED31]|nr:phosphonoacetaldehyde reductase [Pelagibacterales bacterium SAG-MED31]
MWKYYNPVDIVFGANKFNELSSILNNKKYVIVTHPEDIFKKYTDVLSGFHNPPQMIITEVQPNPDYNNILLLLEKFSAVKEIDCIVAIGGGSVTDTAKALASFKDNKNLLTEFVRNKQAPQVEQPIDIIAIPTTSGTSSEFTCWATIWDKEMDSKLSLAHKDLYPKIAIIDPSIMLDKPKGLTISTGLDALSHSMESIWNINANPISAMHGIAGAKMILENLPKLVSDLQNLELRTNLAMACVHAGLAFSNTKTAIAHNISYPITIQHGIQHGIACSFSLPFVMRSMKGVNKVAEERLEKILNDDLDNSSIMLLEELRNLEIPLNLNELKIAKQDWDIIVSDAFEGERGKNFLGNKKAFNKACEELRVF